MLSPLDVMIDFSQRSSQTELIDDLSLSNDALAQNLSELALTNRWLGGYDVTLRGLSKLLGGVGIGPKPLSIADLGCGGGDMLKVMAQWLRRRRVPAQLVGIDANAFMIDFARPRGVEYPEISYTQADVFAYDFEKARFDVVTMTLFCHHFSDTQLIRLLQRLKQGTSVGVVINDLHRHWLAYYSIGVIAWLLRASYLYRHDSRVSVLRSFSRADWQRIIEAAGYEHYSIRWRWAFRWEIILLPTPNKTKTP